MIELWKFMKRQRGNLEVSRNHYRNRNIGKAMRKFK